LHSKLIAMLESCLCLLLACTDDEDEEEEEEGDEDGMMSHQLYSIIASHTHVVLTLRRGRGGRRVMREMAALCVFPLLLFCST
jgi:hypothetical protein